MGLCASKGVPKEELKRSADIERQNREDHEREQSKIKLLLLGAGESGKSTIFKQMKLLYGAGYTEQDRKNMTPVVYNNIITSMKSLVEACRDFEYEIEAEDVADEFEGISDEAEIDDNVGEMIKSLWADPGIQTAFEYRHLFQLNDSAPFYFNEIDRICSSDYIPTIQDVLKSRVRTSGIVEETYIIDGVTFVMYDVGGQRNERKKWIHCFDEVTAVIFVAAISEYDQVLYEDSTQNRVVEAITLFEEICNSRWFLNTSMLLFLNKRDLFQEKIAVKDIRHENPETGDMMFEDYDGGCDYGAGVDYLRGKFLAVNKNPETKDIYTHVTCATDTDNISTVFNACKETILKKNLEGSGFMDLEY